MGHDIVDPSSIINIFTQFSVAAITNEIRNMALPTTHHCSSQ